MNNIADDWKWMSFDEKVDYLKKIADTYPDGIQKNRILEQIIEMQLKNMQNNT